MNIQYKSSVPNGARTIHFYIKDTEKKFDTKTAHYLNYKVEENHTRREFVTLVRSVVARAKQHKLEKVAIDLSQIKNLKVKDVTAEDLIYLLVSNLILAQYRYDAYKSEKKSNIKSVTLVGKLSASEKKAAKKAETVTRAMNLARDLSNAPGGDMTPSILAKSAKNMFKDIKSVSVKVLEESDATKLKMGLFLAVGQGSLEKSKLIICEYKGGSKGKKPIVIIGKGITFDTGGLNLKPGTSMDEMAMDMTGGAVALASLKAMAELGIKKNVVVIVPAVENAISGSAYRPSDIITSMSGTTVQIGNTDAEGRLVLADSITYAKRYKPAYMFDLATLTGAAVVALGEKATAVMTNDRELEDKARALGEKVGDHVWPLPLWQEYEADLENPYADISNIGKTRWGGAITAGTFLHHFVKKDHEGVKWMHFDIAPRMTASDHDKLEKGATGEPVRLLVEMVQELR